MRERVVAVLDVGKTNKKVLIYSMELKVAARVSRVFDEVEDPATGLQLEQPEAVYDWFIEQLKVFSADYEIVAISVTTHGAFGVCVDEGGELVCPALAYTNMPGGNFSEGFFEKYGSRRELQRSTATAEIGEMVNFAKIVHYWKEKCADGFDRSKYILMYPQYFGYKLTGRAGAEPTMLGCHTYLYDHAKNSYSQVAEDMGLLEKLPKAICNSWEVLGEVLPEVAERAGVSRECVVTYGVHDSNSSLLPFLVTEKKDFVLNSTGTWCVVMKQANDVDFDESELGKTVFYNQDVFKRPVKTSVFMGGLEYETYMKLLASLHGRSELPELTAEVYNQVLEDCSCYILPSVVKGAGMFPDLQACVIENGECIGHEVYSKDPGAVSFFQSYEFAAAVLICSLVKQTSCALEAAGYVEGDDILVEGGFRKNRPYLELLAELYPASRIYTTNIEEATALGAAILGVSALACKSPGELDLRLEIEKSAVDRPIGINRIDKYRRGFLDLVQSESRVS